MEAKSSSLPDFADDEYNEKQLSDSEASSTSTNSCRSGVSFISLARSKPCAINWQQQKKGLYLYSFATELFNKVLSVILLFYTVYSLFSLVAWVSHLGERVPFFQNVLFAKGYASNEAVDGVYELFKYNIPAALFFVLPHSLLRPPTLKKIVGSRYARLFYCTLSGFSCHVLIYSFRPINSKLSPKLFTLPVPKFLHDVLSSTMLIFSFIVMMSDSRTYEILGFNRVYYSNFNNSKIKTFSKTDRNKNKVVVAKGKKEEEEEEKNVEKEVGLKRMDIITWIGYTTWLRAGSLGFILFSGLSILPYDVYSWDIIVRVVAASYLRIRSQGFRIWVGQIESTHHFIWIIRALIVLLAVLSQNYYLSSSGNNINIENKESDQSITLGELDMKKLALMGLSGLFVFVLMDRLEKIKW